MSWIDWFRGIQPTVPVHSMEVIDNQSVENLVLVSSDPVENNMESSSTDLENYANLSCVDEKNSLEKMEEEEEVYDSTAFVKPVEIKSPNYVEIAQNFWNSFFDAPSDSLNQPTGTEPQLDLEAESDSEVEAESELEAEPETGTECDMLLYEEPLSTRRIENPVNENVTSDGNSLCNLVVDDSIFIKNGINKNDVLEVIMKKVPVSKDLQDLQDMLVEYFTSIGTVERSVSDLSRNTYMDEDSPPDLELLYQESFDNTYNLISNYAEYYLNRIKDVPSEISKTIGRIKRRRISKKEHTSCDGHKKKEETEESEIDADFENDPFMKKLESFYDSLHQNHKEGIACTCEQDRLLNRQRIRRIRNKQLLKSKSKCSSESSIFLSESELFETSYNSEELMDFESIRAFFEKKKITKGNGPISNEIRRKTVLIN